MIDSRGAEFEAPTFSTSHSRRLELSTMSHTSFAAPLICTWSKVATLAGSVSRSSRWPLQEVSAIMQFVS